jgi:hypothetical protein
MKKYVVYTRSDENPFFAFESEWQFSEKETLFIHLDEGKRVFIVNQITHDVNADGTSTHITRLYCQEKKNYY